MYHDDKVTGPPHDDDVFNKSLKVLRKYANFFWLMVAFHIGQWNKMIPPSKYRNSGIWAVYSLGCYNDRAEWVWIVCASMCQREKRSAECSPAPPPQPVRRMMWTPESVKTGPLMSPTLRAKEASSKGFCIWPGTWINKHFMKHHGGIIHLQICLHSGLMGFAKLEMIWRGTIFYHLFKSHRDTGGTIKTFTSGKKVSDSQLILN